MSRIEKLTLEQEARFPEFVKRWTEIGLRAQPADRTKAEQAARDAYAEGKEKAPDRIVWCDSPISLAIIDAVLKNKKTPPSVGDSVRASGYGQHDAG